MGRVEAGTTVLVPADQVPHPGPAAAREIAPGPAGGSVARFSAAASLTVPPAFLAGAGWARRWVAEDAFITLRVVDQIFAGNGPVFNAGERVEAATSPLWTSLLAGSRLLLPVPVERLSVLLGLGLTLAGLLLATLASLRLVRLSHRSGPVVPLGALVVVAVPPMWDFATSGLETGLTFCWLGGCFWLLARHRPGPGTRPPPRGLSLAGAATMGLGPLVRPDLAVFSVAFLVALLAVTGGSWRRRGALLGAGLALPLLYQVFRMGYYAALVPNAAFAKEASMARWSQGWYYLGDLVGTYRLAVPLAVVGALALALAVRLSRRGGASALLLGAPVVGALLHGAYVVRVGGDFMHGRLLLPALFGLAMPVMVVVAGGALRLGAAATVLAWAATSAGLRPPYDPVGPGMIADERRFYADAASQPNPVVVADYGASEWAQMGREARSWAVAGRGLLALRPAGQPAHLLDLDPGLGIGAAVASGNVGILGFAAGTDVGVVDLLGLGDSLGGRILLTQRQRPGHEKVLDPAWVVARLAARGAALPATVSPTGVAAARRALRCGQLAELLEATQAPLTPTRFLTNMAQALHLHGLRVDNDPRRAERQLCRGPGRAPPRGA
ncbi:MAG: hypothetical protein ACRDZ9_00220 [Acidimicrobiales bacterium]